MCDVFSNQLPSMNCPHSTNNINCNKLLSRHGLTEILMRYPGGRLYRQDLAPPQKSVPAMARGISRNIYGSCCLYKSVTRVFYCLSDSKKAY